MTDHLKPKAGDRVLISGALGSVGRAVTYALKEAGATVVAGVRPGREAAAQAVGLEAFVLDDQSASHGAKSFDGAVDTVGPTVTSLLVPLIRNGGTLAAVAGLATDTPTEGVIDVETVRARYETPILAELAAAMVKGELVIPIARRLPLSQAAEGHRIAASSPGGKVVLLP